MVITGSWFQCDDIHRSVPPFLRLLPESDFAEPG